jgi:Xaa-Pro dipeptidase
LLKDHLEQLAERLRQEKLDALLLGPSSDLEYLTGLSLFADERFKGIVVLADGRVFSVVPRLYREQMESVLGPECPDCIWDDAEGFLEKVSGMWKDFGLQGKKVAVNDGIRAVDLLDLELSVPGTTFVNGHYVVEAMRLVKSPGEMDLLRKAACIADEAFSALLPFIRPGIREGEVARRLEDLLIEKGADGLSFPTIVASGPNGSNPHYMGSSRVLCEGDPVVVDFGCTYRGYCSDTTRTVFVGKVSEEDRAIYRVVLEANLAGEAAAREGAAAQDVDRAARAVIEKAGFGEYFINRTGHGIGVAVHEAPYIMEGNLQELRKGMAFSVEPGIYIPGRLGIRIEDIVLVTENGAEPLSALPKEITIA